MRAIDRLYGFARKGRADLDLTLTEFCFYQPGIL